MNHETDLVYITAKNDQALLERIFKGMFVVARRILGYSPRNSSYPFNTGVLWEGCREFDNDKAFAEKLGELILPFSDYPHKKKRGMTEKDKMHLVVSMVKHYETSKDGVVFQLVRNSGDIDRESVETNALAKQLFLDYFDDMIIYARENMTYDKHWQEIASKAA